MPTITRKVKLYVVGDKGEVSRVYDYLRLAMDATYKSLNECMSALYIAQMKEDTKEDRKELNHYYSRQTYSNNDKESGYTKNIVFPKGLKLAAEVNRIANQKFVISLKNGLMYGNVSLPTFKKDCAVPLHVTFVSLAGEKRSNNGFYHEYNDVQDLINALEKDDDPKVFLRFPSDITFGVCFGNPYKGREQRSVFSKIFLGEYVIQGSSIQIDSKRRIILNLTMNIPKKNIEHVENRVVGIDLGIAIPAMCAMNDDNYSRCAIGDIKDFLRVRTQIQSQRKRLQKSLKNTSSGHGRTKKLKPLDRISERERNFVSTYNHMVSRRAVDFAVKNGATQINIEDLSNFGKQDNGKSKEDEKTKKILRNWSYFELQQQIRYKADQYGIKVRTVNPAYTSQTCSFCGIKGIREEQAKFVCVNPDCKCHKIFDKGWINADFNAARNIAMSTDYTDNDEGKKQKKKSSKKKSDKSDTNKD